MAEPYTQPGYHGSARTRDAGNQRERLRQPHNNSFLPGQGRKCTELRFSLFWRQACLLVLQVAAITGDAKSCLSGVSRKTPRMPAGMEPMMTSQLTHSSVPVRTSPSFTLLTTVRITCSQSRQK